MKIRIGFVSNSSSASFSIPIKYLEEWQITAILTNDYGDDAWDKIWIEDGDIKGDTTMDNFGMHVFLTDDLDINAKYIEWWDSNEGYYGEPDLDPD